MNAKKLARQFAAARKDRRSNFREYYPLSRGRTVLCESESEYNLWSSFDEGLRNGAIDMNRISIRGLFEAFVPDGHEIVSSWDPRSGGSGVSLAEVDRLLMEDTGANASAQFSNITGQIVYNRILEGYQSEEYVFTNVVPTVPTNFNGEKIAGIARIGDEAQVVGENQPYPYVGVSEDYIQTPQTVKRGMIDALTREAIFFDRTGILLKRCGEVGEYLALNKEKRIIDAIIDQNVTTHRYNWKGTSYATYQSSTPWINIATTNGLNDWTDVDAAEQKMALITDPYTGEPILLTPKHLIVTRSNLYTAKRVVHATEIDVATPGYETSGNPTRTRTSNPVLNYTILSSALLYARMSNASEAATDWFLGDVEKAVNYMENFPLTVVQAPANNQDEFTRDVVMQWKASERGAAVVVEPRALIKSTA